MVKLAIVKKIIGTLWVIITLYFGGMNLVSTFSSSPSNDSSPQKTSRTDQEASTDQDLAGEVEVSFKIGEDGRAKILDITSENPKLIDYVKTKLNKIQLKKDDINLDEIITYRFIFGKEA